MRYRWRVLTACAVLAGACGDDGGDDDAIDPTNVTTEDLHGYWLTVDPEGVGTVFGFVSPEEAPREITLAEFELEAEAAGHHVAAAWVQDSEVPNIVQLTTYTVGNGFLDQTVLGDINALPGTQYRTQIFSFVPRTTLELESMQSTTGSREYSYRPRCPLAAANGWQVFKSQLCFTAVSTATSMAFDETGRLYTTSGVGARDPGLCPPTPTFTEFGKGCDPRLQEVTNMTASAMVVTGGVIHVAKILQDGRVVMEDRPATGGAWTERVIDPLPQTGYSLRLLSTPQGLVIVFVGNEGLALYREATGYMREVQTIDGQAISAADAAVDTTGHLVLLGNRAVYRETATGWTETPLPRGFDVNLGGASVHAHGDGTVHVAGVYASITSNGEGGGGFVLGGRGVYGVLSGDTWTEHELGPVTIPRIVTAPDGPMRVVHGVTKAFAPQLAMTTVNADGSLSSEVLTREGFGQTNSTPTFVSSVAAVAADGTIAFSFDGVRTFIKSPDFMPPRTATLRVVFEGPGSTRVRSSDGRLDCTDDCEVEVTRGSRVLIHLESEPGSFAYANSVSCVFAFLNGDCWIDAFDPEQTINIVRVETPVRAVVTAGDPRGATSAQIVGAAGSRLAMSTSWLAGPTTFEIDGVGFPTPGTELEGIAAFDRTTGTGWSRRLPTKALAVAPTDDGGALAIVVTTSALAIDGVSIGAAATQTVSVVRFDATGQAMTSTTLSAISINAAGTVLATAVSADGAAAAVMASSAGFATLGVPESNLVVRRAAAGTIHRTGVAGTTWGQVRLAISGNRTALASNDADARLVALDLTGVTGTRTINGARVEQVALADTRFLAAMLAPSGADLGGGALTGTAFVGEYDVVALAYRAGVAVEDAASRRFGVVATPTTIVLTSSRVQAFGPGLVPGRSQDLPFVTSQVQPLAIAPGAEGLGYLLQQSAVINYGIETVTGAPQTVWIDLLP